MLCTQRLYKNCFILHNTHYTTVNFKIGFLFKCKAFYHCQRCDSLITQIDSVIELGIEIRHISHHNLETFSLNHYRISLMLSIRKIMLNEIIAVS